MHEPGQASGKQSFSAFCSKIAGVLTVICLAALFLEASPEIKELAKMVLKYTVVCWALFAGIPFLLRAPKEILKRAGTVLKYVLLTIAFPFAIRMIFKNRAGWKNELMKFLQEKLGFSKPAPLPVSTINPESTNEAVPLPASAVPSPVPDALPAPFNMLPYNSSPIAFCEINESNASDRLSTAIQMAGLNVEGEIEVISIENGPTLQTIAFRLPPKLQLSMLIRKKDDLANHFGHQEGFDIIATEHQSSAAFVIPNKGRAFVYVRDVAEEFLEFASKAELPIILGKDTRGNPKFADLAKFPHILAAGSTGSGKSVCINTILTSLTSVRSPSELKLVLIDPKQVELNVYQGLPHLLAPPITDPKRVIFHLKKIVIEMDKRYELLAKAGVRNLYQYNQKMERTGGRKLPYHVIVFDEFADLMLVIKGEIEDSVQRLGQLARAAGIHLILATQRPSVDVVTGIIKANLPSRLSFRLTSYNDYRTVMEQSVPKLLGQGDGVVMINGKPQERFQSAAIGNDNESVEFIEKLVTYWKRKVAASSPSIASDPDPDRDYEALVEEESGGQLALDLPELSAEDQEFDSFDPAADELLPKAIEWAKDPEIIFSVSFLQRHLRIGHTRAARIVDYMERQGWIGEYNPEQPGREWLGGDVPDELASDDFEYDVQAPELDDYGRFHRIVREHGGFSMTHISKQLDMEASTAAKYVERMVKEGLLGEFDSTKGMRPYIGKMQAVAPENAAHQGELVEKIKEYICRTRSAKTGEVRDMFRIRKEDLLSIYKNLVEEGFLNDYTSKTKGYTLAWSDHQIEEYLRQREHEEDEEAV